MPKSQRSFSRQLKLSALGYVSYDAYLVSPAWRAMRARYFASDQPQECICGGVDGLQLHHLTYERVGAEELTDLTPLCPPCHSMIHVLEERGEVELNFGGFFCEHRARLYARDIERKRDRRAQDELRARLWKQLIWKSLPAEARLRYLERLAAGRKVDISAHTRVIADRVGRVERLLSKGERSPAEGAAVAKKVTGIRSRVGAPLPSQPFLRHSHLS